MDSEQNLAPFILYGTSACHLCEVAEALIVGVCRDAGAPGFEKVDISDSDELFERYGLRIPVLRAPDGGELGWPFDEAQLRSFLGL